MELRDTSPKALAYYLRGLAALTPRERLDMTAKLWEAARSLQEAWLRHRNPEASDEEIAFRIAVSRFGPDLAKAVFRRS